MLVEDRQHPQRPTTSGRIGDEVPRPHMAAVIRLGRQACGDSSSDQFSLRGWHSKSLHPAQTLDVSFTHIPAFSPQQGRNAAVAIARMLFGKYVHSFP
jgi:hypothetical protein